MKKLKQAFAITVTCCMFAFIQHATAQDSKDKKKDDKKSDTQIRMEVVQEKCKDTPLDKRIRITVARFTSTAGNSPVTLGENMSTMLSNALSQVNCFNVLEEQKHMKDMTGEIDASNSEYSDAATGIKIIKMQRLENLQGDRLCRFFSWHKNILISNKFKKNSLISKEVSEQLKNNLANQAITWVNLLFLRIKALLCSASNFRKSQKLFV